MRNEQKDTPKSETKTKRQIYKYICSNGTNKAKLRVVPAQS